MDRNKNTDWTGAVRKRLEGRELTPSDVLWERIEAAGATGAPRKVRRLPLGGVIGAAAAAALAAVLLLHPAGAPEPGRIDVVPASAPAPLAMAEKTPETVEEPDNVVKADDVRAAEDRKSIAPLRMTGEQRMTENTPSAAQATEGTPAVKAEIPSDNEVQVTSTPRRTTTVDEVQSVSIEEYIAKEEEAAARRRHRSLSAAVFASGMPSSGISDNLMSKDSFVSFNPQKDIPSDAIRQSGFIANDVNSGEKSGGSQSGYTSNPESPQGFTPVKYAEDPYNINGNRMNHSRPVSAGLALTMPLNGHLFAESGVYWSWLRSTSAMVSSQSLHSIGIPLKLGYSFGGPGRISFSLSAGAKAEKVVYAVRGGTRFKEPGIQLAAVGDAAVQFGITQHLGLFIAPELSYWFTRTELPTYNTEHPFNLSLKAGLNLTLGQ